LVAPKTVCIEQHRTIVPKNLDVVATQNIGGRPWHGFSLNVARKLEHHGSDDIASFGMCLPQQEYRPN
jgi:hypothetical protein